MTSPLLDQMPARACQEMCVELEEEMWEFKSSNCRELGQIFSMCVECTGIPQYVQFHCPV